MHPPTCPYTFVYKFCAPPGTKDNFHPLMACHPALVIIFHGTLIRSVRYVCLSMTKCKLGYSTLLATVHIARNRRLNERLRCVKATTKCIVVSRPGSGCNSMRGRVVSFIIHYGCGKGSTNHKVSRHAP